MPTTLLVGLTVLASVYLLRSGSWLAYAVGGLAVGLATSTKYTAVFVAVPVIFAALLRSTDRADLRRAAAGLPLAGACAVLAFLATTPYALLDRPAFLAGLQFERHHYATGHAGMEGNAPRFYAAHLATHEGLLAALALTAVVVVTVWARQRWRAAVVLGSFPVIYGAVVAMQAVRNDRTIMLILPPLAVLAALAIEPVMTWAHHHRAAGLAAADVAVVVLVVGVVIRASASRTVYLDRGATLARRAHRTRHDRTHRVLRPLARPRSVQGDRVHTSHRLPAAARGLRGGQRADVRPFHLGTGDLPRQGSRLPATIPGIARSRHLR